MRGRLRCFVVSSALLTLNAGARAQGGGTLSVEREAGAEDCPDVDSLEARVASIRGRAGTSSNSNYAVTFSHAADTYTAIIRSGVNGESQRILEGHGLGCSALAQASAVTLALLLDSESDSAGSPKPEPEPPPPPPKPLAVWREPFVQEQRRRPVQGALALGGVALVGVLRPLSPAFTAELGLHVARFRVGIGVLWNPTQSLALDPGTVRESLLGGSTRTCFALTRANGLSLDLCSGLLAGMVTAQANGFTQNLERHRPWLAVPMELSLSESLGPVGWELSGAALGNLVQHDFEVSYIGVAYRSPRVGAMLSLRAVGLWSW